MALVGLILPAAASVLLTLALATFTILGLFWLASDLALGFSVVCLTIGRAVPVLKILLRSILVCVCVCIYLAIISP